VPRATDETKQQRLDIVEELWRKCVSNARIEAQLALEWQITRRQVRKYIAAVVKRNAGLRKSVAQSDAERAAEFERTLSMFEDIYLEAREGREKGRGRDLKVALNAAHRRAQLLGQYPANRFEVTGANGRPLEIAPEAAVDKLLQQLDRIGGADAAVPAPAGTNDGEE